SWSPACARRELGVTWVKVLDRLSAGEMPPKGRPRPTEDEARAVIDGLRQSLHDASLARQRAEGRVVLRRLNRVEYETTLRDLLATPVVAKDRRPDATIPAGSGNRGGGLPARPG